MNKTKYSWRKKRPRRIETMSVARPSYVMRLQKMRHGQLPLYQCVKTKYVLWSMILEQPSQCVLRFNLLAMAVKLGIEWEKRKHPYKSILMLTYDIKSHKQFRNVHKLDEYTSQSIYISLSSIVYCFFVMIYLKCAMNIQLINII